MKAPHDGVTTIRPASRRTTSARRAVPMLIGYDYRDGRWSAEPHDYAERMARKQDSAS